MRTSPTSIMSVLSLPSNAVLITLFAALTVSFLHAITLTKSVSFLYSSEVNFSSNALRNSALLTVKITPSPKSFILDLRKNPPSSLSKLFLRASYTKAKGLVSFCLSIFVSQ